MKFSSAIVAATLLPTAAQQQQMVKMCLFYDRPSGHARSDPIINNQCTSSHVHTFYGPQSFHPSTSYDDLLDTPPSMNTSPFVENKSLYWHPSIYRVSSDGTHTRVDNLEFGPYYRWDKSVYPLVEPFPPGFRMIAASNDPGTCGVGDTSCTDGNFVAMFTECCDLRGEQERCNSWEGELFFPKQNCDFVGIALAMPTCWDGRIDSPDHKSHMAYTIDGQVNGECPASHTRRLPQVQVFIRIPNYRGEEFEYVLSDGNRIPGSNGAWNFHTDFFNGWDEGKFQEIMDNCAPSPEQDGYNPPCDCTPGEESTYDGGLTPNTSVPDSVCDADVKRLIVDEEIKVTSTLPLYSGSCMGSDLKPRFWTDLSSDLFSTNCNEPITEPYYTTTPATTTTSSTSSQTTTTTTTPATTTTTTTTTPATTTTSSTSSQTTTTTTSTTPQTTTTTTTPQTTTTTTTPQTTTTTTTTPQTTTTTSTTTTNTEAPPGEVLKAIVCGNGGDCAEAPEGWDVANTYDRHEVRCCRECIEGNCPRAWKEKCPFYDDEVYARSKIKGACREEATFLEAIALCNSVGGRLCTPWEVFEGCTAGTGCGFDREMIWACSYEGHECEEDAECCGLCVEGFCEGDPQDLFA